MSLSERSHNWLFCWVVFFFRMLKLNALERNKKSWEVKTLNLEAFVKKQYMNKLMPVEDKRCVRIQS